MANNEYLGRYSEIYEEKRKEIELIFKELEGSTISKLLITEHFSEMIIETTDGHKVSITGENDDGGAWLNIENFYTMIRGCLDGE